MTNADRIRQMTDEELAYLFCEENISCNKCVGHPAICNVACRDGYLKWLKQEVCEDDEQ